MNLKKIIGGVAVLGVIVGGYLGGLFPKLGNGPGLGPGGPNATVQTGDPAEIPGPERSQPAPAKPHVTPEQMAPLIPHDEKVLNVCIDGDDFLLGQWRNDKLHFLPSDANAIVAAAKQTAGNERGIRVRVDRTDTAKAGAEVFLEEELTDSGIDKDSIQWLNGPRP